MNFAERKQADEQAEARTTALVDAVHNLARITAIMERANGVRNLADAELTWVSTPEGTEAIRMWRRFRDAVDLFDATMTDDWHREQAKERGQ
jgi:hypothetical protein